MKIEKGMTLEQFVDYVDEYISYDNHQSLGFEFIKSYNNRLKEPLTKDMFVNPYEEPKKETYFVDGQFKERYYLEDLETWQEAEKKVMFQDVRIEKIKSLRLCKIFAGNYKVAHDWGSEIIFLDKTLGDLFRATNGELELKNFEI